MDNVAAQTACIRIAPSPAPIVYPQITYVEDTMSEILGVDLAKDSFDVARFDLEGNQLGKVEKFENNERGCKRLLKSLSKPKDTYVVFEATGVYGKILAFYLHDQVAGTYELNPAIIKKLDLSMVENKTDEADAVKIAKVAYILLKTAPKKLENNRIEFNENREDLSIWISEYQRLRLAVAKLRTQIKELSYRVSRDTKLILKLRGEELHELLDKKKEVEKTISKKLKTEEFEEDAELLQTIPGIAALAAASIVVKIKSIERFESADALKAYIGFYPRRRQSGKTERKSRMAKNGNALLRHMFWNCARSAARYNPICKELFDRLVKKGKTKGQAYGAVARKLIQICYGVLKNKEAFCVQNA